MIRKILHRMLEQRYHWRTVGFSELAELYANRLLRLIAINLVSGIVGVFMYQLGYKIWMILLFFSLYFLVRSILALPSGFIIGRIGPKHAMLMSNFLQIPALLALTQLQGTGVPALVVYGVLQGFAFSLYTIAYHVSFSKVKHSEHAGKEISFMYIVERVGTALSPLFGGLIAYLFGPEVTIFAAMAVFVLSAGPLFLTPEAVMTRQHLIIRGLNWRHIRANLVSSAAVGADQLASVAMWSLFVAVAVFGTSSNIVYAQIGGLLSLAFLSSVLFSRLFGLLIDRRHGDALLKVGVIGTSLVHMARPFVATPLSVVGINITNEAFTSGFAMPYLKGMYDMADGLPGYRIIYISFMETFAALGGSLFGFVVCVAWLRTRSRSRS